MPQLCLLEADIRIGNFLTSNFHINVSVTESCLKITYLLISAKQLYYFKEEGPSLVNYEQDEKVLRRRYFLIEKIKDSSTVGIVIGTLGVKNYLKAIERLKKLFLLHQKKYYMISVGKPTVAKLANFPEVILTSLFISQI